MAGLRIADQQPGDTVGSSPPVNPPEFLEARCRPCSGKAVPEYPDLTVYLEAIEARALHRVLLDVRLGSPFVLRTAEPPLSSAKGKKLIGLSRIGKRLVFALEGEFFLVIHLMISGRLFWKPAKAKIPGRTGLVAFDFETGTLILTE